MPIFCNAFTGSKLIATGELVDVALRVKKLVDEDVNILIFDDKTSERIDIDFRGTAEDVRQRLSQREPEEPRGPGRPRLGVVAREVTLLPRHWDWLNIQPGGASVALRKLVEEARRKNEPLDRVRQAQESTYRFLSAMAGNEPGFEEAARALFAGKQEPFDQLSEAWPVDVRDQARKLARGAFAH
jgi:hypothetical protein